MRQADFLPFDTPVDIDIGVLKCYTMYTVFSDKERMAITAGLEDAAQGLGGCRDLIPPEGDSEAFDKGGPRGTLVPDITGRERWVEARPDATYASSVSCCVSVHRRASAIAHQCLRLCAPRVQVHDGRV